MERAFRGVWIPAEIYLDGRLTPTEVCLLAEIESLDTGEGCYADNKYLADFGRCDVRTVSRHIAHLRELGLINVTIEGGLRRLHRLPSPKIERNETVKRFIPPTVEDIKAYCEINNLGFDKYIGSLLKDAFMKDKYGEKPNISKKQNTVKQEENFEKPLPIEIKAVEEQNTVIEPEENLNKQHIEVEVKPKTTRRKLS